MQEKILHGRFFGRFFSCRVKPAVPVVRGTSKAPHSASQPVQANVGRCVALEEACYIETTLPCGKSKKKVLIILQIPQRKQQQHQSPPYRRTTCMHAAVQDTPPCESRNASMIYCSKKRGPAAGSTARENSQKTSENYYGISGGMVM